MKLTILMDNNTYIDQYYLGEPAFSVYIEDGAEKPWPYVFMGQI